MEESFWVKEIKLWLLDHAIKHDMNTVVKYVLKDKATTEHLYKKISDSDVQEEEAQPTYLFLLLLEHLKASLQNFQPPDNSNDFSWDKESLNLIIDLLDDTYKQTHFTDFFTFMKLSKLLKLMVMFRMAYDNIGSHAVCAALNMQFPHWTEEVKRNLVQTYGSQSEPYMDDIKETNSETRKFILKLLLNARYKELYLRNCYGPDVQKMVQKAMPLLDVVIIAVKNLIGPSTIDQIVGCVDDDIISSNDPAVQIILEYLKPDMTESDFLELLKILEFPDSQDDNMNISFGSPLDEVLALLKSDDGNTQMGRGLKLNILDDDYDAPPSCGNNSDVIPSTVQKQYGPLGLGPPSAKKNSVEEASEEQAAQEQMELVLDSEDEEEP